MLYNLTLPITASRVMGDTSMARARREGFTPEAIDAWGITFFPMRAELDTYCAYCLTDIKFDVAASDRYRACSVCIKALAEGRMPARLLPDGTFKIGRADLSEVLSDKQVEALLRDRDFTAGRVEPVVDDRVLALGETDKGLVGELDRLVEGTGVDGGDPRVVLAVPASEISLGADQEPGGAVSSGAELDSACGDVRRDVARESGHDSSSSVGGDAAQSASVTCTPEPTEEAPRLTRADFDIYRREISEMYWQMATMRADLDGLGKGVDELRADLRRAMQPK